MKLPQKNIKWLGKLIESLYISLPILSIINFLSITTVLYASTRPYIAEHLPWVTFWMFLLVIAGLTWGMVLIAWIFIVPSVWALRGDQMFSYESGFRNDLKAIKKEIKEVKKELREGKK